MLGIIKDPKVDLLILVANNNYKPLQLPKNNINNTHNSNKITRINSLANKVKETASQPNNNTEGNLIINILLSRLLSTPTKQLPKTNSTAHNNHSQLAEETNSSNNNSKTTGTSLNLPRLKPVPQRPLLRWSTREMRILLPKLLRRMSLTTFTSPRLNQRLTLTSLGAPTRRLFKTQEDPALTLQPGTMILTRTKRKRKRTLTSSSRRKPRSRSSLNLERLKTKLPAASETSRETVLMRMKVMTMTNLPSKQKLNQEGLTMKKKMMMMIARKK